MKTYFILFALIAALMLPGCATLFTGTTQRVTIESTPAGADIIVDGKYLGTTPARVRLDRNVNAILDDGQEICLEKEGYLRDGYYLGADIEPVSILNMFNVFFWAVDAATGAVMRYDRDYYNFMLVPYDDHTFQGSYSPQSPQPQGQPGDQAEEDDYERLMKLVELYEEGLISEEEFETEKAKIFENRRQP